MKTIDPRSYRAIAVIVLALCGCEKEPHTDISTILARHTEARGGVAAIEAVQALEVNRTVQEGKRQLITHYIATRDGRMRLDVSEHGEIVFSEGYDGETAWQRSGRWAKADDMPDWAVAAVKRSLRYNLYGLHELAASGTSLKLAERERVAGGLYNWVIEATDSDGYKRRLFIDPYDFMIIRVQESSALYPDRSNYPTELETHFLDFREVDGVMFSFASETYSDEAGQSVQKTSASSIVVNPEFDPSLFSRPVDNAGDSETGPN